MKNSIKDTKYGVVTSNKFNKQLKKIIKQGKNNDTKYYRNWRECHIEPDWLLVYKYNNDEIILYLVETGSHSDLFNM